MFPQIPYAHEHPNRCLRKGYTNQIESESKIVRKDAIDASFVECQARSRSSENYAGIRPI